MSLHGAVFPNHSMFFQMSPLSDMVNKVNSSRNSIRSKMNSFINAITQYLPNSASSNMNVKVELDLTQVEEYTGIDTNKLDFWFALNKNRIRLPKSP